MINEQATYSYHGRHPCAKWYHQHTFSKSHVATNSLQFSYLVCFLPAQMNECGSFHLGSFHHWWRKCSEKLHFLSCNLMKTQWKSRVISLTFYWLFRHWLFSELFSKHFHWVFESLISYFPQGRREGGFRGVQEPPPPVKFRLLQAGS